MDCFHTEVIINIYDHVTFTGNSLVYSPSCIKCLSLPNFCQSGYTQTDTFMFYVILTPPQTTFFPPQQTADQCSVRVPLQSGGQVLRPCSYIRCHQTNRDNETRELWYSQSACCRVVRSIQPLLLLPTG